MITLRAKNVLRNLVGEGNILPEKYCERIIVPIVVSTVLLTVLSMAAISFGISLSNHDELLCLSNSLVVWIVLLVLIDVSRTGLSSVERRWEFYYRKLVQSADWRLCVAEDVNVVNVNVIENFCSIFHFCCCCFLWTRGMREQRELYLKTRISIDFFMKISWTTQILSPILGFCSP